MISVKFAFRIDFLFICVSSNLCLPQRKTENWPFLEKVREMYVCVYVRMYAFVSAITFYWFQLEAWNFQERLITIYICALCLCYAKSRIVSSYERKRVFTVLVHLKLKKCSNLTEFFLSCWYHKRLFPDCKWVNSDNIKAFKTGDKKCKKKHFPNYLSDWAEFGIKRRRKSKLFRIYIVCRMFSYKKHDFHVKNYVSGMAGERGKRGEGVNAKFKFL